MDLFGVDPDPESAILRIMKKFGYRETIEVMNRLTSQSRKYDAVEGALGRIMDRFGFIATVHTFTRLLEDIGKSREARQANPRRAQ